MSEFDYFGNEISADDELLIGGRVAQLGAGKILAQVGPNLVQVQPEKCLKAAAVPQAQRWTIVAGVNNGGTSQTSCLVITSSDTLPIEPGLGVPIPAPAGGMVLTDVRGCLRHFTGSDPGDWTLALKRYNSGGGELESVSVSVPLDNFMFQFNSFNAQPSMAFSVDEFFGATFTGPAASYLLGRFTFTFERSIL